MPAGASIVVATHNVMHGRRLDALVAQYLDLRDREGLDLFCLQEDRFLGGEVGARPSAADRNGARRRLPCGPRRRRSRAGLRPRRPSPRVRYERDHPLPRLPSLSWFERRYIVDGKAKQKHALRAELRIQARAAVHGRLVPPRLGRGGQRQRAAQAGALAAALAERDLQPAAGGLRRHEWLLLAARAAGARRAPGPVRGARRRRSGDAPDASLRAPKRTDAPAPDRRCARQARARHPAPLRRRLYEPDRFRTRPPGHARLRSRFGLGASVASWYPKGMSTPEKAGPPLSASASRRPVWSGLDRGGVRGALRLLHLELPQQGERAGR